MKKLSIVTAVYYNEGSLRFHADTLAALRDRLRAELDVDVELIYVNDGSGDNSFSVLTEIKQKYPDWITVVSLSKNFGAIPALRAGVEYITGDCFTTIAADLQDPPELIYNLVSEWKAGSEFTICVRENRDDPFFSTLFSKAFNFLARKLIISNYPKGGYDLFLIDKKYFGYLKNRGKHFYLQLYCYWLGVKPKVIYYTRRKREHGKSRWTFRKKMKLMVDSFVGFSSAPIHFVSLLGIGTSTISFLYGIYMLFNAITGHIIVPGFATIICILSFLLGLIIFMLGIVGEYLARIYDEVNHKPEYVIEKVIL